MKGPFFLFFLAIAALFSPRSAWADPVVGISGTSAIRLGAAAVACDATMEGSIRYDDASNALQLCDDGSWITAAGAGSDVTSGLIGWWKFDESSGTTAADSSGNGRNGTTNGSPAWQSTGGQIGGALSCDGVNDYVSIPDNAAWDVSSITISIWVNKKTETHSAFATFFARQYGTGNGDLLWFGFNGNDAPVNDDVGFGIDIATGDGWVYVGDPDISTIGDEGVWVHWAATFDGTTMRLYRNGRVVYSNEESGSLYTDTTRLTICAADNDNSGTPSEWVKAWVDDARIYNRALTAAEVRNVYLAAGGIP